MRYGAYVVCCAILLSHAGCTAGGDNPPVGGNPPKQTQDASPPPSVDTAVAVPSPGADAASSADVEADIASPSDTGAEERPVSVVDATAAKPDGGLTYKDFVCSWVLGIHTTSEWYAAGFEKVVDDARWQVSGIEMAQFEWAKPNSNLWNSPITSPCTTGSKAPDRIVFTGVDGGSTTAAQFLPQYLSVVNIIKTRYPSVKRIDLMTLARAPGNMECKGANRSGSSWIRPGHDEAIDMTVAMFPGFVFRTPKWEVKACSDFGLCPHISAAANADLAKTIGDYFLGI